MLIFCLDYCCADSGLLGVEKAELLERFAHRVYAHALIVCNERRSKADNDRVAALEQDFYFSVSSTICFASCGHTTKHWPQSIHSLPIIYA